MKNALCLITHKPSQKMEYIIFLNSFTKYDVYVVIDDETNDYSALIQQFPQIHFIQVSEQQCVQNGYVNLNQLVLHKYVSGWDKAMFYFSSEKSQLQLYSNVWFFEDDVWFHSEQTLERIDQLYPSTDILCNSSFGEANLKEWLWNRISIPFSPPYYCGMMCIIRLSAQYLSCVHDYVARHHTMFFLEAFFPTLAKMKLLSVVPNPPEFLTVKHREEVKHPNNTSLYHPVKDMTKHLLFRENNNNNNK